MDSKKYIVYNKARETFLTSSATSVNSALEPLKVLKVLIEGLPANSRTGLWLTNFKGVPVARTLSPFDLIYLDNSHRTLHSVALSKDAEFAPYKGLTSSALVLPAGSISASKTRDGDELELRPLEIAAEEPTGSELPSARAPALAPATAPGRRPVMDGEVPVSVGARFYSAASPATAPAVDHPPLGQIVSAQSALPVEAPRPESAVSAAARVAPEAARDRAALETTAPVKDGASASAQPTGENRRRRLVTGPILTPQTTTKPTPPAEPAVGKAPIPFPGSGTGRIPPRIQEVPTEVPQIPIHLSPQQWNSPKPAEEAQPPSPPPSDPVFERAAPVARPAPRAQVSVGTPIVSEPLAPPPVLPPEPVPVHGPGARYSWKVRALRWLFPELVIQDPSKIRNRRKADRQTLPGLIAYFFTGGAPLPQKIRNISVTGFYLETEDRWMPGTVVRMTLQRDGSRGDDPSDTITVNSRIVRWGPDGEGFEFILTDLEH